MGDGEGAVRGYFRAVGRRKAKERRAVFERHNAALQRLSLLQHRGLDASSDIAKALMRRFQGLITSVIGPDQTCSVQVRSINDNLLLVRELIIHSWERRSPLCLLSPRSGEGI